MLYLNEPNAATLPEYERRSFNGGSLVWTPPGSPVPPPDSNPAMASKASTGSYAPRVGDCVLVTYDTPHSSLPQFSPSPNAGKKILRSDIWLQLDDELDAYEQGGPSIDQIVEQYHQARICRSKANWDQSDHLFQAALSASPLLSALRVQPSYDPPQ